jgi:Tol biopolymer transport system component
MDYGAGLGIVVRFVQGSSSKANGFGGGCADTVGMIGSSVWIALALSSGGFSQPEVHAVGCSACAALPAYDWVAGAYASRFQAPPPNNLVRPTDERETNLFNVRQLTFGGQNAEAYWNVAGDELVYQTRQPAYPDEQIFKMKADGSGKTLISTGKGRTTCSYFSPNGEWIYYSSTHDKNEGAQKTLDMSRGYVWMVNPQFSLFRAKADGSQLEKVIDRSNYVAETTIDPNGRFMVFTGGFDGDLDIYRADLDGKNIKRLTDEFGYDGGPFVSWDGKKIVYRRSTEMDDKAKEEYRSLLAENLVRPSRLEIWIMDADGKNKRQVTKLNAASFAPFLHPNGKQIIFSSNFGDPRGREFDLYMIHVDGTGLKRITFTPDFDGFPMFTKDGKKLVWASNRFGQVRGETNLFVADWKD